MNRRDFTRGLLALGAAPALPLSGAVASTASAAGTSATASHMYFMGWYTARMNASCSRDMLVSKLNVDADVAQEIFGKLVSNNTVSAPNALGISQTVDPLPFHASSRASGLASVKKGTVKRTKSLSLQDDVEAGENDLLLEEKERVEEPVTELATDVEEDEVLEAVEEDKKLDPS